MPNTAATVFRVLASCTSFMMGMSPSINTYRIYKTKNVGVTSFVPLASLFVSFHIWMIYTYLEGLLVPMSIVFLVCNTTGLVHVSIYWRYTTERAKTRRIIVIGLAIVVVVSLYAVLGGLGYLGQSYHDVTQTMGYIADVSAMCLYGAPMEKMYMVVKHKSGVFFQIHMVLAGMTNNAMWSMYGILAQNWFILFPNALFLTLGVVTLILYVIYNPKTHPLVTERADNCDVEAGALVTTRKVSVNLPSPAFEAIHSPLTPVKD